MSSVLRLMLLVLLLSGCATVYEDKYAWSEGWRDGQVVKLGNASAMAGERDSPCTKNFGPDQEFALISYRTKRRPTWKKVRPVPPGSALAVGDEVYIDSNRCDAPVMPRTDSVIGSGAK